MPPTRRQVANYVNKCARLLGVDRRLRCQYEADLPAHVWAAHECAHVDHPVFVYGPKLLGSGARTWRLTVAHELMHAHLRHLRAPLEATARCLDWYEDTEEEIVERLEPVLARLLPDPPWRP